MRWISSTAIGSTPANGSSSRMKRGRAPSARAISTRRRSPPDRRQCSVGAQMSDLQVVEQLGQAVLDDYPRQRTLLVIQLQFEDGTDVFLDRELAEDRSFLRQVGQAESRAPVNRQMRYRFAIDHDVTVVQRHQADHHVEAGRLAGAVRAEQAHDLAALHGQRDVFHDRTAAVALLQVLDTERAARQRERGGDFGGARAGFHDRVCCGAYSP